MDPIAEQIVQDIASTLSGVSVDGGYQNTFVVTREDPDEVSPVDMMVVVAPVEPEQVHEQEPCMLDEFVMTVGIIFYAIESEQSDTPISARLQSGIADIHKALGLDVHRGGRAVNTQFEKDQVFSDALPASALIPVKVRFRTLYNNPYQR